MIDTDLTACINAILTFPELDHPCLALIIKINRLTVEDHIKICRRLIKEPAVSKLPLPGICGGSDDILPLTIRKAERTEQIIQEIYFFTKFHATDFADDAFFPSIVYNKKNNADTKKDSEKQIHKKILRWVCFIICKRTRRGTAKYDKTVRIF